MIVQSSFALTQTLLVKLLVIHFLMANTLADRTLMDSYRHEASPCPEVVTAEISVAAHEFADRSKITLDFDLPNHTSETKILGGIHYGAVKHCQSPGKAGGFPGD